MLFYNDLIKPQGEYTYSANVQFDIADDKKLMRFIPNEMSIELFKQYLVDISSAKPNHHSRILYGSYGTGKSHFLTVLSLLLGKMHVEGVAYHSFLNKISKLDEGLANDIDAYIGSKKAKPFLIVPIVFDFEDFDRCIYYSLQKSLEQIGISITFKNYYTQALNVIDNWNSNDDSKSRLKNACKNNNTTLSTLKKSLKSYNPSVVSLFEKVFSEMTYGVPFIYETTNLSESIKQAYEAISEKYAGFVFIFDEFGRYIEDNIKKIKVKQIQDLAEYCDHGDGNNHIILVSHKEISLYTSEHGESLANEWKKVEGRFTATPINDKQDQCLSLISSVLEKDEAVWSGFKTKFNKELSALYNSASDFKGFLINNKNENPYEAAFPLHPVTLFALDKLSKKVAQNERTFFTYLSSLEENSLNYFLVSHELDKFNFVGIDDIFDYFELSIKAIQTSKAFSLYKEYSKAVEKGMLDANGNSIEIRILKVLTIINIIGDSNALNADVDTFCMVIDAPDDEIKNAVDLLVSKKIIKYFGTNNQYRFYESSIFDIEELIKEKCIGVSEDSVSTVLNEHFINFVLYPYSYNNEYKTNRVFIPVFATASDLAKHKVINNLPNYYDGSIIMVISSDNDKFDYKKYSLERSILFINKDASALINAVKDYIAILNLESTKEKYTEKDAFFEKELEYYKSEQFQVVSKLIKEWTSFAISDYSILSNGKHFEVNSFRELSILASDICYDCFPNALVVNNELINKNAISGSMRNARKKALDAMINNSDKDYYELPLLSPEYLIIRSVLANNAFIRTNDAAINTLNNIEYNPGIIGNVFKKHFKKAKNGFIEILDLYNELKSEPYGLKDGYLPVLFAAMMLNVKGNLIVSSHGTEQELTSDLFVEMTTRPKDFALSIADWSDLELNFVTDLQNLFKDYIKENAISKNRLKAIYEGMFSHYRLISKFSRSTQVYVSDVAKKYRSIMETTQKDYSKFIFEDIAGLAEDEDLKTAFRVVNNIKSILESSLENLINDVVLNIKMVMRWESEFSLSELLIREYNIDWKAKRQKSFDFMTNSFFDYVSKLKKNTNDEDVLNELAVILTGFECEYWSDKHRDEFISKLTQIKSTLDKYEVSDSISDSEIQISLTTKNGVERKIKFDKNDLSPLGETMKNKIGQTLDNFGMAVSYDDKVQIILSILEELIEGK